ncbi:MAG: phage terminase large subunit [Clostridia bacterium]|nr:phage terminase large subunit [Clostridia bacterium]
MELELTPRQWDFVNATADEVLYGGAAGGGKSYGQLADALLYALQYPGSRQLLLRRTYPELEKSLVRGMLAMYPRNLFTYKKSEHTGRFCNGSLIDLGYCDHENDVYKYQSSEYDVIRFDELTHFTEQMYVYLISRLRGANGYPKQVKSSTNPGGLGHGWVKERFVDIGEADKVYNFTAGSRIFLPAGVRDNHFLMQSDPDYVRRLENLSEKDKRALLYGDWDLFDGQFFDSWRREIHVVSPFPVEEGWRKYFVMDYGLDMLAGYLVAVDGFGNAYVYKELYEGKDNGGTGHIVSSAADRIKEFTRDEQIYCFLAPPDLWSRQKDSGKSMAALFAEQGVRLTKAPNARSAGWMQLKEWLRPVTQEDGKVRPRLRVFSTCVNLIRTLPALSCDPNDPGDCMRTPHELTHAPDALRYFAAASPKSAPTVTAPRRYQFSCERPKCTGLGQGEKVRII